jgi:ribosomal protein S18 acetylase RimI-like enzyme
VSISNSISRVTDYYARHGFAVTIRRARLAAERTLFAGRMVVFYCDLDEKKLPHGETPEALKVERLDGLSELTAKHLQEMTGFWNEKLANRNIRERFEKGAWLWLLQCDEQLAGYGWTLRGGTIKPYCFPLAQDDVHLFDFHVFPHYRGRGMNRYLISRIVDSLSENCGGRAFIEAAEWNEAQLSSLAKTSFRCLGSFRSFCILGATFVSWR